MSIRKTGDWKKTLNVSSQFASVMEEARDIALSRLATKAKRIIKGHIDDQDLGWKPLSEEWLETRKSIDKSDTGTKYYFKGKYYRAIQSSVKEGAYGAGTRKYASVILRKDVYTSTPLGNKRKRIVEVAEALEAMRPLWLPSAKEVEAWQASGANSPNRIAMNILKRRT